MNNEWYGDQQGVSIYSSFKCHLAEDSLVVRLAGDEQTAEVWAAGGEDQLVGVEGAGLRLETDVSEGVGGEELTEQLQQRGVVTAPLENILRVLVIRGLFGNPRKVSK